MADHLDRLVVFLTGAQPTRAEHRALVDDVAAYVREDPEGTRKSDSAIAKLLDSVPREPAWQIADQRESLRLGVALLPDGDPLRRIVDAHDPTVAFDRARKHVVTEATLVAWRDAAAYLTKFFGVAAPPSDFIEREREVVHAGFAGYSNEQQDALSHVARNFPATRDMLGQLAGRQRASAIASGRGEASDRVHLAFNAANFMAQAYRAEIRELVTNGLLLNSAANYNMLYHSGYTSGIYR